MWRGVSPNARLALVTPSCQYPLGMTMSLSRRMELLEWANRTKAWIIEDDYGSEFRYHSRPLASLQGLDRGSNVIYIGSLSRVLFPALRASYIVAPDELIDPLLKARAALFGPQNTIEQAVAADFIEQGHFVRHLRRMREVYLERQDTLLRAATRDLAGLLTVNQFDGGTFLIGWLSEGRDDVEAAECAARSGLVTDPVSPLYSRSTAKHGLFLGYSAITPRQIRDGVRRLAQALRGS